MFLAIVVHHAKSNCPTVICGLCGSANQIMNGTAGSDPTRTTHSHLKRIISTNSRIHTVVPPDDGPKYARNVEVDEMC